jgi:hypothetical protein
MAVNRRNFIKNAAVAGAIATVPASLQANNMTNWLCVVVETIDELSSDLQSTSNTVVVKDIKRGGIFIYVPTKSDINDGGVVINGWVRQYNGPLNVQWFGAVGDGVADDTQAIQTAIFKTNGWNGARYDDDHMNDNPRTVYIPEGKYRITDSLQITQMVYLIGDGYNAGSSKGTEIICDFTNFSPPTNNYSNTYEGHPVINLDKKPMLYNVKMFNYNIIKGIRFNANNQNVYALHLNDCYYSKILEVAIINCPNSGFTMITGQYNEINTMMYVNNGGPIRFINCCTLDFTNLDLENTQSLGNDLEIVHFSEWKGGINIRNVHIEEIDGSSKITKGSTWLIGQKGVKIEGVFGLFSTNTEAGSTDRYIHFANPQQYYFDGNTITTSIPHDCILENVGSGHMYVKMDSEAYDNKITGIRVVREEGSKDGNQIDTATFDTGFKIKNLDDKKALWFDNDNSQTVHLFDNANRKFYPDGAHFMMENTYGRIKLKAGDTLPDINLIADYNIMLTRDSRYIAQFTKDYIKLHNLPTSDPGVKDQLWNDNGTLKISL